MLTVLAFECAANFPSLPEPLSGQEVQDRFFLFPSINFTCATTVNGWVLVGNNTGSNNMVRLSIQTWRTTPPLNGLVQYRKESDTGDTVLQLNVDTNLYEYTFGTPIQVMPGDVLAIRVPDSAQSDVLPLFRTGMFNEYFTDMLITSSERRFFIPDTDGVTESIFMPQVRPIISGRLFAAVNN